MSTVYLVSSGVFQRYVREHRDVSALAKLEHVLDWQWLQKFFERRHVHRNQLSRLNDRFRHIEAHSCTHVYS